MEFFSGRNKQSKQGKEEAQTSDRSISSRSTSLLAYHCFSRFLMVLCISLVRMVMCPLSFLILLLESSLFLVLLIQKKAFQHCLSFFFFF